MTKNSYHQHTNGHAAKVNYIQASKKVPSWDIPWLSILPVTSSAQLRQYVAMLLWKDLVERTDSNILADRNLPDPQLFSTTVAASVNQPPLKLLCNLIVDGNQNEDLAESRSLQSECIKMLAQLYQLEIAVKPEIAHTDLGLSPRFWVDWQAIALAHPQTTESSKDQQEVIGCAEPYSACLWIERMQKTTQINLIEPWLLNRFLATKHAVGIHTGYITNETLDLANAPSLQQIDLAQQDEQSIVHLCHSMLADVITKGASDLHLDNQPSGLVASARQDGILNELFRLNPQSGQLLTSRVKLLAGLDITEQRLPQDGRISLLHSSQRQEIRMSVIPTVRGEKIVLRFFDQALLTRSLADIGMPEETLSSWKTLLNRKDGLLLTVGPTGSGKTSTLYSSIKHLSSQPIHICTVEDPVEIINTQINQVQVDHNLELGFSKILRHLLRQDPDIIMIGEIRDQETALIAVQAALTGHLVLASLHTKDTIGAIMRLRELGVAHNMLRTTLEAVVAQRLIRCICPDCTTDDQTVCPTCSGTGYKGRRAVFELLITEESLIDTIEHQPLSEVAKQLKANNHLSLWEEGMALVEQGITNFEEIERICPRPKK